MSSVARKHAVSHRLPPVVIYQSADREGSTFALSPDSKRALEARFRSSLRPAPRVFIAHGTDHDFQRIHGSLSRHLLILLTGLEEAQLQEIGDVQFQDPVTERRL